MPAGIAEPRLPRVRPQALRTRAAVASALLLLASCASPPGGESSKALAGGPGDPAARAAPIEGRSLFGEALHRREPTGLDRQRLETLLAIAQEDWERERSEASAVWLGRRHAYLGRHGDAIAAFERGLIEHPESAALRRHLGHRLISLRRFERADRVLTEAALALPDAAEWERHGDPGAQGPRSTLQFATWYHLGLARYLRGDFQGARRAYLACLDEASYHDDKIAAAAYWLCLTLWRLDRLAEADEMLWALPEPLDVVDNGTYAELLRLFRGEAREAAFLGEAAAMQGSTTRDYGVACWLRVQGREDEANALLTRILEDPNWSKFGLIAAEADLARIGAAETPPPSEASESVP